MTCIIQKGRMLVVMQDVKANFMSSVVISRLSLSEAAERAFTVASA
jgi:hypothetical protein